LRASSEGGRQRSVASSVRENLPNLVSVMAPAGYIKPMADLKKRIVAGILATALALTVVACDSYEDPPGTTTPGYSETTEPVGS
jgi:hypothetical protein